VVEDNMAKDGIAQSVLGNDIDDKPTTQQIKRDQSSRAVYAVIPVHNRRPITRQCLLCLHQQTFSNLKIIVVDDGSTDGTSEMIRAEFPEVILLHGDGNLWWTGATNMGVRYAMSQCCKEDYILIINDDVFVHPDYVVTLFNAAENSPGTLVQSVYADADNVILDGGTHINWITAKWRAVN
jgi:GT2 family glycosyltransferase